MKKILLLFLMLCFALPTWADKVNGYYRKSSGIYVNSYNRSHKNYTKYDNYSTRGNINPYTGKKGYSNPYKTQSYNSRRNKW